MKKLHTSIKASVIIILISLCNESFGIISISNSGSRTATNGQLTIFATTASGNALQDAGDEIDITTSNGSFGETANDLPTAPNLAVSYTKSWKLVITDANSNGGILTLKFDVGKLINTEYSYYLLERSGTSGTFSVINSVDYTIDGQKVVFKTGINQLTSSNYYTLGRSNINSGYSLNFDNASTADGVELPIYINPYITAFTIECWVKPNNISTKQMLFDHNVGFGAPRNLMYIKSNGRLATFLGNTENHSLFYSLSADKWNHCAITCSGSEIKIYVNGLLTNTQSITAESVLTTIWHVGRNRSGGEGFDGEMDEVRIWNDVRTHDEIRTSMHKKLAGSEANLFAYYRFDHSAGTYLSDYSGNGKPGVLEDFALSNTTSNWVLSDAYITDENFATSLIGPGKAVRFYGDNDYILLDNFLNPSSSNWTVECWIKGTDLSGRQTLISQKDGSGTGRAFLSLNNGKPESFLGGSGSATLSGDSTLAAGIWYHLALSWDGTTLKYYLDGELDATSTSSPGSCIGDLILGSNSDNSGDFYNGLMDEMRFWNVTRNVTQIDGQRFGGQSANATGLTAYYIADDWVGDTLDDLTANGYHGNMTNFWALTFGNWVDASDREPYKTIQKGDLKEETTWKGGKKPHLGTEKVLIGHKTKQTEKQDLSKLTVKDGVDLELEKDITINDELKVKGSISGSGKLEMKRGENRSVDKRRRRVSGSGSIRAMKVSDNVSVIVETDDSLSIDSLGLEDSTRVYINVGRIEVNSWWRPSYTTYAPAGYIAAGASHSRTPYVRRRTRTYRTAYFIGRNPFLPIYIEDDSEIEYDVGVFDKVYDNPTTNATELSNNVVSETWIVQPVQAADDVTIHIGWQISEETTGFDRDACAIAYWEEGVSTSWNFIGVNTAAIDSSGTKFQSITLENMSTNRYFFGIGHQGSALPVELVDFNVTWENLNKTTAQLNWQTAMEENNSHFEIERSMDGQAWENIGRVEGAGNSISAKVYSYVDKSPSLAEGRVGMGQTIYYRLKQVDYNGAFDFSEVRTLNVEQATFNSLSVYPNPANKVLHINNLQNAQIIKVYNLQGQKVLEQAATNPINVSSLLPGMYMVEIKNSEGIRKARFNVQ